MACNCKYLSITNKGEILIMVLIGIVRHFVKYSYSLSNQELIEKTDISEATFSSWFDYLSIKTGNRDTTCQAWSKGSKMCCTISWPRFHCWLPGNWYWSRNCWYVVQIKETRYTVLASFSCAGSHILLPSDRARLAF